MCLGNATAAATGARAMQNSPAPEFWRGPETTGCTSALVGVSFFFVCVFHTMFLGVSSLGVAAPVVHHHTHNTVSFAEKQYPFVYGVVLFFRQVGGGPGVHGPGGRSERILFLKLESVHAKKSAHVFAHQLVVRFSRTVVFLVVTDVVDVAPDGHIVLFAGGSVVLGQLRSGENRKSENRHLRVVDFVFGRRFYFRGVWLGHAVGDLRTITSW